MFGMLYNMRSPHGANLDIWGKWDDSAAGYPLLGHLLDSALMGEILFEEWLPSRLIKQIDAAVAGSTMTSREIVMPPYFMTSEKRLQYFKGRCFLDLLRNSFLRKRG